MILSFSEMSAVRRGVRKGMLGVSYRLSLVEHKEAFVASPTWHESYGDDHPNFSYDY